MDRRLFTAEHELFARTVSGFVAERLTPHLARWEDEGICDREVWTQAAALGLLGLNVDEAYGGGGTDDFRYNVILNEELTTAAAIGVGFTLANDVVAPYLIGLTTPEQRDRWLPGFCAGELVAALAITEPDAGSDVRGISTSARPDGDDLVVNGQKTFISNGVLADLVVVAVKTAPGRAADSISLVVVEEGMPGFIKGRNLKKIGRKIQDTAELFFTDVRVPSCNVLGEVGGGFRSLMKNLAQERLTIAVTAVAACESVLAATLEYARTRTAFGQPIGSFQHNRFVLASLDTEVSIARAFVDRCVEDHIGDGLDPVDAAKAKWWTTELEKRTVDACLQLYGGYGYMAEQPVARAYLDARVQTIHGGTTEIMKEIIGRSLGV